jgi:hypothetical protein
MARSIAMLAAIAAIGSAAELREEKTGRAKSPSTAFARNSMAVVKG